MADNENIEGAPELATASNASDAQKTEALYGSGENTGALSSREKGKWKHTGIKRVIVPGPEQVIRTPETSNLPEGTVDIQDYQHVVLPQNFDEFGLASFTAAPGTKKTPGGYDWFNELRNPYNKVGIRCDVPGDTYEHGEGGPIATHFITDARNNPYAETPHALCDHHTQLFKIANRNFFARFTRIKPEDVDKHFAKLQAMKASKIGTMESALRSGGMEVQIPAGAEKPPVSVSLPPEDLLYGQETATGRVRSGRARGEAPAIPLPEPMQGASLGEKERSLRENAGWLPFASMIKDLSNRRTNEEKEAILNDALAKLRSRSKETIEDDEAHIDKYHSSDSVLPRDEHGNEYCPKCQELYELTADLADRDPITKDNVVKYSFTKRDPLGILRVRKPGLARAERKAGTEIATTGSNVSNTPPRPNRETEESVPFGNRNEYERLTLPAHMLTYDESTNRIRAVTPEEKAAEEQAEKMKEEKRVKDVDESISNTGREQEAFRQMSRNEQIAYLRSKRKPQS